MFGTFGAFLFLGIIACKAIKAFFSLETYSDLFDDIEKRKSRKAKKR